MSVLGTKFSRNNNEIPRQIIGTPVFQNIPQRSFNASMPKEVRQQIEKALTDTYGENVEFTGFALGWNGVPDAFGEKAKHPIVGIVFADFKRNGVMAGTVNQNKVNVQMIFPGQRYWIKLSDPTVSPAPLDNVYIDKNGLFTNSAEGTVLLEGCRFVPNSSVEDLGTVKTVAEDGSMVALIEFAYGY